MKNKLIATSKFLSLVLRHRPGVVGLALDAEGWVEVEDLLRATRKHGRVIDRELLEEVVVNNDKQRFAFSADGSRIRARQGHSIPVDLGLDRVAPPVLLYHGTVKRFLPAIRRNGLVRGRRQHVHLSVDLPTATRVGSRRGLPVVLVIEAARMHDDGHEFFRSENGVWLTESVPARYIRGDEGSK